MSQSEATALPSFYGDRPSKDGVVARRPSQEDDQALLRSDDIQPPDEARASRDSRREISGIGPLAFEDPSNDPPPVRRSSSHRRNNEVTRWIPNREYGRYWEDRRGYGTHYRQPYYRDDYDDPDYDFRPRQSYRRSGPPVSINRYGSMRGPPPPPPRHHIRPSPTPKSDYYSEDEYPEDEYADDYGAGGGGRGGYGRRPPPRDREPSEILRLPWTMWMNSEAKNRKLNVLALALVEQHFDVTRLCRHDRRICWYDHVPPFCVCRYAGCECWSQQWGKYDDRTGYWLQPHCPALRVIVLRLLPYGQCIHLLPNFRRIVQPCCKFPRQVTGFHPRTDYLFQVSLAMAAVKAITPTRAFILLISQLAGAMLASELVNVLFPTPFNVRTTLSGNTSLAQGVLIEAILTAELVFTIFMLAKEKHKATFMAPVGIGLALFVAELVGVYYTGGSLNPARSFGPCVITGTFDREHWIYCKSIPKAWLSLR
jgi:aquaporin rerated protein, other eukaryote